MHDEVLILASSWTSIAMLQLAALVYTQSVLLLNSIQCIYYEICKVMNQQNLIAEYIPAYPTVASEGIATVNPCLPIW